MSDNELDTITKPDPLANEDLADDVPAALSDNDVPIEDAAPGHDSDDALSEIDENQFEDYDPETADIEDRPVVVDEDIAKTLKASRRKRADNEPRKPKEGRREKKRTRDDDDGGADDLSDGRGATRKSRRAADGRQKKATPEPENEDHLSPEERRQRAIERALDAALKKPKMKRKRKGEDVCSPLLIHVFFF
jgi:transcription factor SPN1